MEYVKEKETVQIISRIFIDDFERLIRTRYDETITLSKENESDKVNYYISKYLNEKIGVQINGKPVKLVFIGKEYENDLVYCYLEIKNVTSIKSFEIINQVLFDVFSDQKNIVRTDINGQNKSFMLVKRNDKGMLNF
ncbi:peptidase E [Bizionia myxarmorum]|uniref:Peptidase E n=1 Tax=Bizionia myxarmorum TaxID=291186 RepID=A0A5D0RHF9_9FLAO|nr:peptidase E [Bizionia myxarmorum]